MALGQAEFLTMTLKIQSIKIDKQDFIQIKMLQMSSVLFGTLIKINTIQRKETAWRGKRIEVLTRRREEMTW